MSSPRSEAGSRHQRTGAGYPGARGIARAPPVQASQEGRSGPQGKERGVDSPRLNWREYGIDVTFDSSSSAAGFGRDMSAHEAGLSAASDQRQRIPECGPARRACSGVGPGRPIASLAFAARIERPAVPSGACHSARRRVSAPPARTKTLRALVLACIFFAAG